MGYDKFNIDWSVFGTDKPKAETSGNPMQGSIGKGWGPKEAAAPVEDSDSADSETETSSTTKSVRITSAKFLPDAETDFLKECKIQIEAQGDPSVGEVALWGTFNGTDYDLRLSKTVDFTDGIAESTIPLEHVDEFYNEYYSNGNSDAFIDYFFYVSCSGAEKKKSDLLRMPLPQFIECDFVELHDALFHHNCALPSLDPEGILIDSLVAAFKFASENADREVIIEGHADKSGDPNYNLTISKRRAEAIKALVDNDESLWKSVVSSNGSDHKIETEDYQQPLKSLATKFSWPCDPGEVDNKKGPKTEEAVRKYQTRFNQTFPDKEQLGVDGDFGPKSWGSLFFVLRDLLEKGLKSAGLESSAALTYGYPEGNGIYPCGECCSLTGQERSAEDRRVELVFYKKEDPTPAIAPAANREIGATKDPVSEKEWRKQKIAPFKGDPLPIIKCIESESVLPEYWDPFLFEAPVKVIAAFSINVAWKGEITAMLLKGTENIVELPIVSPYTEPIKVEWTGLDASGVRQPEATYSISLRLMDKGSIVAEKASSPVKLIRIGIEEISFSDSFPIRIYNDEIKSLSISKAVDFSIPVPQWKIESLNDPSNTKPHDHPAPSLEDRSNDPDNYNYPVCYPVNSKSPAMVTIGGKGFEKVDSLSVTLVTSINNAACLSSDNQNVQMGSQIHFENIVKAVDSIQETVVTLTFQFGHTKTDGTKAQIGKFKIENIYIYTILTKPQEPWNNDIFTSGSNLWISVLQLLCSSWAKGLKTVDDAASAITDRIFNSGFKYDTVQGASFFTSGRSQSNLKDWLMELNLPANARKPMNCTDCATILTSLANSLGCELFISRFYNTIKRGFDCHKIISIGFSNWDYPFSDGSRGGFSYHEIGWKNTCDESDPIFDPCLKTAKDPVNKPAKDPELPVNITFDVYEPKLVVPADLAGVKPAPTARIRLDVQ
jgi:peptidoglycan hydrolase-like protein with peptidoglycan-binding domain